MSNPDRFLMAGVMGSPVMHSRIAEDHNYWFAKYGLAGPMCRSRSAPRASARAAALYPLGFAGCNLTIPHKEARSTSSTGSICRRGGSEPSMRPRRSRRHARRQQ